MKATSAAGGLLLGMVCSPLVFAGDSKPAPQIDALFRTASASTPGAAVLVIENGHTVFQSGYGVTDLRTLHRIDEHTNFRLASVTKQFTAMAIMLLVHEGKLGYEQTLAEIFPESPAYGKAITIRHLLNHTSGLLDYEDLRAQQFGNRPDDQIPQIHDAGVLAMVVEKVSGKSFGQFLHERIFGPLQMTNTIAYEKGKNKVPHRAYGHTPQAASFRETDQSSTSATLGDGGVYSSLADLARWDAALRGHTLLSEKEMQPALTPVQPAGGPAQDNGRPVSYGFGWFVDPYKGHPRMWHYGETAGFRTSIQRFPADHLTVVVLSNRVDFSAPDMALKIADI